MIFIGSLHLGICFYIIMSTQITIKKTLNSWQRARINSFAKRHNAARVPVRDARPRSGGVRFRMEESTDMPGRGHYPIDQFSKLLLSFARRVQALVVFDDLLNEGAVHHPGDLGIGAGDG